jgi:hypothetical protein
MQRYTHFMPGQFVKLNKEISDPQAQGYGLTVDDPRGVINPETEYEVSGVDVRKWSTRIYLYGVPGCYSSACFYGIT